jgi:hypothetical protein
MRLKFSITAFTKAFGLKESRPKRMYRETRTVNMQTAKHIYFNFESVRQLTGLKDDLNKSGAIEPYACLAYLDKGKVKLVSDLEALQKEYERLIQEGEEFKIEFLGLLQMEENNVEFSNGDFATPTYEHIESAFFEAKSKNQEDLETPLLGVRAALPRPTYEGPETDLVKYLNYLSDHCNRRGEEYQIRYLSDKGWIEVGTLGHYEIQYQSPPTKQNLISYFNLKTLIVFGVVILAIELAEVTNSLSLFSNVNGATGLHLWSYIGVPLALSIGVTLFFKKELRGWLHGDISHAWRTIPKSIYLVFILGICLIISNGLLSSDINRIDRHLAENESISQEDDGPPSGDFFDDTGGSDDTETALPTMYFNWVIPIQFVLLPLFLALSAGVLNALFILAFKAVALKWKIDKTNKRLDAIRKDFEYKRIALSRLRPIMRTTVDHLGKIEFLEQVISCPFTEAELCQILDGKSSNHTALNTNTIDRKEVTELKN